jgi:hypothetical protein
VEQCSPASDGPSGGVAHGSIVTEEILYSEQLRLHIAKLGDPIVLPRRLRRAGEDDVRPKRESTGLGRRALAASVEFRPMVDRARSPGRLG